MRCPNCEQTMVEPYERSTPMCDHCGHVRPSEWIDDRLAVNVVVKQPRLRVDA